MFRKFIVFCFLLFLNSVFAQQNLLISVQTEELQPLENVIVSNLSTGDFNYTDENGQLKINYKTELDSFKIMIPSFEDRTLNVTEIQKLNNLILMKEKPILLEEVMVISAQPKSKIFYKLKTKKKYFSPFISSGGAIVSPYVHKKQKLNKLSAVSLFFDNTKLQPDADVKIRLLIFKDDNKWIPIIESPTAFSLSNEQSEVTISFKNNAFEFEEGKRYLIGFELINKEKVNTVTVLSTSIKNSVSYVKPRPNNSFYKMEKETPTFSIYYEVYFEE